MSYWQSQPVTMRAGPQTPALLPRSPATTSTGALSTTLKKTRRSYAAASIVFGRHRPARNSR